MKKFNFSKVMIIALLIVIAAVTAIVVSSKNYSDHKKPSAMTQTINAGTGFVDKILAAPVHFFQDRANQVHNLLDTYKQNESLKSQLTKSNDAESKLKSTESENKALKAALKLQETLTNYDSVSSNVINRSPSSWNDNLIIDQGTDDGVQEGMIVMGNAGVIGRVSQANKDNSKVALLSSASGVTNKIPVKLGSDDKPTYGLLTGYDSHQAAYIVSSLTTKDQFAKGTSVVTSGLGGSGSDASPSGLSVGTVIGEKDADSGLSRQVYVKPVGDLYDIRFAFVIKGVNGGN
ncbi:rod shape-determining protein MreC [Lactococcus termiticola]|uniref:rod shape-determining protein MreC n=1 Tax=Lactococcus termiticola TaxID=2169526 RepID=UPI000D658E82|nr:rod shape-determining protein MreC [Lactococcus termiticola]